MTAHHKLGGKAGRQIAKPTKQATVVILLLAGILTLTLGIQGAGTRGISLLAWTVPRASGTQNAVHSIADSYTSSMNPDANYGDEFFLDCYYYTYEMLNQSFTHASIIWLKFNLTSGTLWLPSDATVNSIVLRMHTTAFSPVTTNKIGVFLCSESNWNEWAINWNNSPQVAGSPIATALVGAGDEDCDFNVTSVVGSEGVVTLVLKTLESTSLGGNVSFYSRHWIPTGEVATWPRLLVEYSSSSQSLQGMYLVPWVAIFATVGALVVLTTYFMIRRRRLNPSKTPARRRDLIRICG